jgi:hypothetical protein
MEQKLIMRLLKNMEFVLCIENLLDYWKKTKYLLV